MLPISIRITEDYITPKGVVVPEGTVIERGADMYYKHSVTMPDGEQEDVIDISQGVLDMMQQGIIEAFEWEYVRHEL